MKEARKKVVIDANRKSAFVNFREILDYKDLFLSLAYRDYRARYAQTFLGFTWAFIQPLFTILIATVIFGTALEVDTGGVPYPLFACCGLLFWSYFAFVLNNAGSSIIGAQAMVKKIYFPRLIIPLSKSVVGFIDFSIVLLIMIGLMTYYYFNPTDSGISFPTSGNIFYAPLFFIVALLASLGVGIWMSALTIRYRDFKHIVPFLVQFGIYATPVMFPSQLVVDKLGETFAYVYYLNPMAGVIEGFRWSLYGGEAPSEMQFMSFGIAIFIFITSLFYFKRMERKIADII